jgi:hypothetical protein
MSWAVEQGDLISPETPLVAGPSQVLVSSTVKDLMVGPGLQFVDRGEHSLKGVPGLWRTFAVDR